MKSAPSIRRIRLALAAALCALAAAAPAAALSPVAVENALPGNPASEWDIDGAGDPSIQGFATNISVNRGQPISFKVLSDSGNYRLDIYRLGYYGGLGARKVATVQPSVALPQSQPPCLADAATGLVDCGNWAVSATWTVPASAVSGVYIAKLVREDPEDGRASHIAFVVRNDSGGADILFQTSDTTWQAYNQYGGNSLYVGAPDGRAYKVSYNRPFTTRETSPEDWVFNAEYPMIRWLERNGFDVSYASGVDADRSGAELLEHAVYLSVGHDEYWSGTQRANVEAARDAGVHLAFFSGNEVFWKTRWEPSIDGSGTAYRTLVTYKETHANAKIDPLPGVWTGTWRDPRFSPPADGGRPENALSGTIFTVNCCSYPMTVPAADGKMRFWRGTSVATLGVGQTATLPSDTVGYEWDEDLDNGARPAGLVRLSTTTVSVPQRILDFGSNYGPGAATHRLTLHRAASGALVFGAGTVQWSWGLDDVHDRGNGAPDSRMQQATVNLLADMGVQPTTLQAGLSLASASTDHTAPSASITNPTAGFTVESGVLTTITGTASDGGGGVVGGIEVSVDGGLTWHPASGRGTWTYAWLPGSAGAATIRARAVDDSGNLGAASAPIAGTIEPHGCASCLPPGEGPGGPILVVASASSPFSRYYAEILLAEGLNAFDVVDLADLTRAELDAHEVAILAEIPLSGGSEGGGALLTMLSDWVAAGGKLVAMRPDPALAGLLGLTPLGTTLSDAYLAIDTGSPPGAGLVGQTMQFHGTADRYALNGASAVATLYGSAGTATASPAVSLRHVGGNGGVAAAFTYDLARSVVYTRQGNPAWAGQERDGTAPVRSDDLFYGAASFDPQPDWVDLTKVAIPQADEQQRLLANLLLAVSDPPLPRFWYFPHDKRAVVVQTGDQHGCCGGTRERFGINVADSPAGCSLADWECVRSTSYIYSSGDMDDAEAASWAALGFDLGVHVNTDCADWTPASLASFFDDQFATFAGFYPSLPAPVSNRTHCIAWSDWVTQPRVEADHGVRLDTNYYYWPPGWVQNRPGFFTGSGMPMRFADVDGTLIDVYQATTQMTDESDQSFPFTIDTLLDRATGSLGYYGAFTTNMHTDTGDHAGANAVVASAQARGVPLVSARQMLEWLDARNSSAFVVGGWNGYALTFSITPGSGAVGLRAMLPPALGSFPLVSLTRNAAAWPFTAQSIKGVNYGVFNASAGNYVATYSVDADGDGVALPADCDDGAAGIHPGASEVCNGLDDDCDLQIDENNPGGGAVCVTGQLGVCAAGTRQCLAGALQCVRDVNPGAEVCDGFDNDCDGSTDEGDPGGGAACSTGSPGSCAAGIRHCQGGVLQCVQTNPPASEVCNGLDDDCDGSTDEGNPGGGGGCTTGELGVCAAGTRQCTGGALQCMRTINPGAEVCDGLDNDCDGSTDEDDPGGGGVCNTGNQGVCALGINHCQSGAIVCVQALAPTAETCNGLDDNCNGAIDEGNPGGNLSCSTGLSGVCAAGTTQCSGGSVHCNQNVATSAEVCDGLDNDCDGSTDEGNPGGGATCGITDVGACALGTVQCVGGGLQCVGRVDPQPEVCDGVDNDCDGSTDEGDPGGGGACLTGELGVCAAGIRHCQGGALQCVRQVGPSTEVCNAVDDDCDGAVDEGMSGGACDTGLPGLCAAGTAACIGGVPSCQQNAPASPETCNGIDDDCDGSTDEGNPGGGIACSTGLSGICAAGTTQCQSGALRCVSSAAVPEVCNGLDDDCDGVEDNGDPGGGASCDSGQLGACAAGVLHCQGASVQCFAGAAPATELCATGVDEDCDGTTDEAACDLCAAADTVSLPTQTTRTTVRIDPSAGRIQTKGEFVVPANVAIAPASEAVTVRLRDGAGGAYVVALPAGTFTAAGNGRTFKFSDVTAPYEHDGLQKAYLKLGRDLHTVRYAFKARGLAIASFAGGAGELTVRIGSRCFTDSDHVCTVKSSGAGAKCE